MPTSTRTSRAERKAQTRVDLVAAARRVFLRYGFHGASLEEIADDAGYTKGAVYSNFAGKDDLFLALLEEHYAARTESYRSLVPAQPSAEDAYRAVARFMVDAYEREPGWWNLLAEFSTHAAGDEMLLGRLRVLREGFLDAVAGVIEALAEGHGLAFALPAREVARGSGALLRGLVAEWSIDPALDRGAFEEMHAAYMRGLELESRRR